MGSTKVKCWIETCDKSPFEVKDEIPGTVVASRLTEQMRQVVKKFMTDSANKADTQEYRITRSGKDHKVLTRTSDDAFSLTQLDLKTLQKAVTLASLKLAKNTKEDVEYIPVVCPKGHHNNNAVKPDNN